MVVTAHFLACLGWTSMLLLPLYLAHLGATRGQIGSVMAAAAVGGLFTLPLCGWALDRLGRRPVLAVATILQSAGLALVAAVRSVGPLAYAQRVLFGVGAGTILAGYFTYASDLVPAQRRTEGIALFGISGLMPLCVNPLAQVLDVSGARLRWLFPVVAVVSALSLLCLWRLPETRPDAADCEVDGERPRPAAALNAASLRPVWLATVLFATQVAVFMAFVTVTAEHRGIENPASLWLTYAGGATAIRLLAGSLPDRIGPHNLVAPSIATYAAACLVAAASRTSLGFLAAGALAGLGHGYTFPVLTSQVATRCPLALRGAGVALFTALWEAAFLGLTPLFGAIADASTDATMFGALALWALCGLCGWTVLERSAGGWRLDPRRRPD